MKVSGNVQKGTIQRALSADVRIYNESYTEKDGRTVTVYNDSEAIAYLTNNSDKVIKDIDAELIIHQKKIGQKGERFHIDQLKPGETTQLSLTAEGFSSADFSFISAYITGSYTDYITSTAIRAILRVVYRDPNTGKLERIEISDGTYGYRIRDKKYSGNDYYYYG